LGEGPIGFGNNTYFGTKRMVPLGRNMKITFHFWSVPLTSERSEKQNNTFAIIFSLGPNHPELADLLSTKERLCPRAQVYFRYFSKRNNIIYYRNLEEHGEAHMQDSKLLESLERKFLERFDEMGKAKKLTAYNPPKKPNIKYNVEDSYNSSTLRVSNQGLFSSLSCILI